MKYTILLIVLPLLLGFLSMLLTNQKKNLLYLGVTLNVALLFILEKGEYFIGGFHAPYGINLVLDHYSYIGIILINTLFFLSILSNHKSIDQYSTVLLTLLAGVNGMVLTGDLFNLFVFIEITTISAYILTTQTKKYVHTFNYLIVGSIGSGLYLLGVIMLYAGFGSLNLADIALKTTASDVNLLIPLMLIFVGLSVETKLLPFNGWVKGIYATANGLVGSLMASVVATAGLLVMGRILGALFIESAFIRFIVLMIAVITLISGEFSAFNGKTIKEILLYSSIGQSGLITLLMVAGLTFPAVLILINNAISKLIMFTIADEISSENDAYSELKGGFTHRIILGLGFTIGSFSLIGLPLFLGFYAKINSLIGLLDVHLLLPIVVLTVTIVEGAYLIRLNIALWHPGNEGESVYTVSKNHDSKSNTAMILTVALLSTVILATGLMPSFLGNQILSDNTFIDTSSKYLMDLKGGM